MNEERKAGDVIPFVRTQAAPAAPNEPAMMPMDALDAAGGKQQATAGEAYILNPYPELKMLTLEQAFDAVAYLMGPIQAAVRNGRR